MERCQGNTGLGEDIIKAMVLLLPVFRYMKSPVDTVAQLYEKYPTGNERGTYAYVIGENTFYFYMPSTLTSNARWVPISSDLSDLIEVGDTADLINGDSFVWDADKGKFVIINMRLGGIIFRDIEVQTVADLASIVDVKDRWGVYVISESRYYQYDGVTRTWGRTPFDKSTLDVLTKADVVDNLASDATNLPLSAGQGKRLYNLVINHTEELYGLMSDLGSGYFFAGNKGSEDEPRYDFIYSRETGTCLIFGEDGFLYWTILRKRMTSKEAVIEALNNDITEYDIIKLLTGSHVVDRLTESLTTFPLSANQGMVLKSLIDDNKNKISELDSHIKDLGLDDVYTGSVTSGADGSELGFVYFKSGLTLVYNILDSGQGHPGKFRICRMDADLSRDVVLNYVAAEAFYEERTVLWSDQIEDSLLYPLSGKVLDARQGKVLNDKLSTTTGNVSALETNKLDKKPDTVNDLIGSNGRIADIYMPEYAKGDNSYQGSISERGDGTHVINSHNTRYNGQVFEELDATTVPNGVYFIVGKTTTGVNVSTPNGVVVAPTGSWIISNEGANWDVIGNTDEVTGVKGNAESEYRSGAVNLTLANIVGESSNTEIEQLVGGVGSVTADRMLPVRDYDESSGKPTWNVVPYDELLRDSRAIGELDIPFEPKAVDPAENYKAAIGALQGQIDEINSYNIPVLIDGSREESDSGSTIWILPYFSLNTSLKNFSMPRIVSTSEENVVVVGLFLPPDLVDADWGKLPSVLPVEIVNSGGGLAKTFRIYNAGPAVAGQEHGDVVEIPGVELGNTISLILAKRVNPTTGAAPYEKGYRCVGYTKSDGSLTMPNYWIDTNGGVHLFTQSDTPFANFGVTGSNITIAGQSVAKVDIVELYFNKHTYLVTGTVLPAYFMLDFTNLRRLTLPDLSTIRNIQASSFGRCSNLEEIIGVETLANVTTIGSYFCLACKTPVEPKNLPNLSLVGAGFLNDIIEARSGRRELDLSKINPTEGVGQEFFVSATAYFTIRIGSNRWWEQSNVNSSSGFYLMNQNTRKLIAPSQEVADSFKEKFTNASNWQVEIQP